jgi:23S rRNA pseudouridine2605 synthase
MLERLQKILSRAGVASRRAGERLILEGRVTVNGEPVRELGSKADVEKDDIRVDGTRVKPPKQLAYLLLNKPKGVVTTRRDPEGRTTVMDLLPNIAGLFPVGRLDVTTEGLLLLTNDGAFAQRVAHPRYEVPRVYEAKVRGLPDAPTLARLRGGVRVEGELMAVDRVRVLEADKNAWLEITLHEGKNREVKRLLDAVGHPVSKLRRVSIGPLTARGLKPGEFRALSPREIQQLTAPREGRQAPAARDARESRTRREPPSRDARRERSQGARRERSRGARRERSRIARDGQPRSVHEWPPATARREQFRSVSEGRSPTARREQSRSVREGPFRAARERKALPAHPRRQTNTRWHTVPKPH